MTTERYPEIIRVERIQDQNNLPETGDLLLGDPEGCLTDIDLREMQEVLYAGERHAVVTPRTTIPGFASSFPIQTLENKAKLDKADSEVAHNLISSSLPRYTILQDSSPFPMLVRGDLMRRFQGLSHPPPSTSATQNTDWSAYGYSQVMANRVLINQEIDENVKSNSNLQERTPEHSPLEKFAPLFSNAKRLSILIDLTSLRPCYNGTAEFGLAVIKQLIENHQQDVDITLIVTQESATFHSLERFASKWITPGAPLEIYDIGYAFSHMINRNQWNALCDHCLKVCISVFDLIWIRCTPLSKPNPSSLQFFHEMFQQSDGILTISRTVQEDLIAYMPDLKNAPDVVIDHILPTVSTKQADQIQPPNPNGSILLIGNEYAHKAVPEALQALQGLSQPLVVFGMRKNESVATPLTTFIEGGQIPEEEVQQLFQTCAVLVYPSQYEGFGMPLAHALTLGKPCVVFDTPINREVVSRFALAEGQVHFCARFSELRSHVEAALLPIPPRQTSLSKRTWDNVANDMVHFWKRVNDTPLNHFRLTYRINMAKQHQEIQLQRNGIPSSSFSLKRGITRIARTLFHIKTTSSVT